MIIGTIKETSFFETRTAITPQSAKTLINLGYFVLIEKGCGKTSGFSDNAYRSAGAKIISSATKILSQIDILLLIVLYHMLSHKHCYKFHNEYHQARFFVALVLLHS